MFNRIRQFIADQRTWRAFKRQTIATFGKPGFGAITYKGVDVMDDPSPQTMVFKNDYPIAQSIDELVNDMNQPAIRPLITEQQLKMNIINRRLGV